MLASHLSPASRAAMLPQLRSSKIGTSTGVLGSMSVSRSPWCHQQTRGIKLEFWSWNVQPGSQGQQHRHKVSKSAYIEVLNRRLLRHRHHRSHISHSSMKSFMCSALHESKSGIDLQKLKHDATRTASNLARAASGSTNNSRKATADKHNGRRFYNDEAQTLSPNYDIDPITNRKVLKQDSVGTNIPVKKFNSQKSPLLDQQSQPKQPATIVLDGSPTDALQSKTPYVTDSELYRDGRTVQEELGVYKPFRHNEPDGHFPPPPDPVEEALSNGRTLAEELGIYKPFRHNEPDGRLPPSVDSVGEHLGNGPILAEELRVYKPFQHNEPDGHFPPPSDPVERALNEYDQKSDPELDGYEAFRHNEPDGHLPLPVDPVKKALSEFDQKWEPKIENDNFFFDEDFEAERGWKAATPNPSSTNQTPTDIAENYQSSKIIKGTRKESKEEKRARRRKLEEDFNASSDQFAKDIEAVAKADKSRAARKRAEEFEIERSELLNHHGHIRGKVDARLKEIAELDQSEGSKVPQNQKSITGNFARDFPEEYSVSWGSNGGPMLPKPPQGRTATESLSKAGPIPVSEFSRNPDTPRLQTSLERDQEITKSTTVFSANEIVEDLEPESEIFVSSYGAELPPTAKAVQESAVNTETVSKKDKLKSSLANELRRIYEETYGTIEPQHRHSVGQFSREETRSENQSKGNGGVAPALEPTFYKILAYNPDTQTILTTETTSIVPPGNQKPYSPASVLPRLSKPAKFLPHISSLLNEGYEIASGNGHVLVFRKVRDGPPLGNPAAKAESDEPVRKMTNPIDGMQSIRPTTGNFASPTGFVNHDLPEYHTETFKSEMEGGNDRYNYDSSRADWRNQDWADREARRQRGMKKVKRLLVGAVWVGGLSYAVGVVAEFFRTGGAEGKGAVGL